MRFYNYDAARLNISRGMNALSWHVTHVGEGRKMG